MANPTLTVGAGPPGNQAELSVAWPVPAAQPRSLRLTRRRWGYSVSPDDGRVVLDLADLHAATGRPWGNVLVSRFLIDNPRAECGAARAELREYFTNLGDAQPAVAAVAVYQGAGAPPQIWTMAPVSHVVRTTATGATFGAITTVTISTRPSGGTEAVAGTAVISTQPTAAGPVTTVVDFTGAADMTMVTHAASPSQFAWTPAAPGSPTVTVPFSRQETQTTVAMQGATAPTRVNFTTSTLSAAGAGNLPVVVSGASASAPITVTTAAAHGLASGAWVSIAGATGNTAANGTWAITVLDANNFVLTGSTGNGAYAGGGFVFAPIVRTAVFTEGANALTGQLDRSITVTDREPPTGPAPPGAALRAGVVYYYTAFQDAGAGLANVGSASALVTGDHGFSDRLFQLLPAVHQYYDDPASGNQGNWQLRRFLGVFGPALDFARGLTQGLRELYDPFEVRAEFLPLLARTIGWTIDRTLPTQRQRGDLLNAPEVYGTIGTVPNLCALANRGTGWACQAKEMVNNVFLTNDVEPDRLFQLFETSAATPAVAFAAPAIQANLYPLPSEPAVTQADPTRVDARPATVIGTGGTVWLFWHSTRLGSEWQASTAYAAAPAASLLAPISAPGLVFECTTAGTSGTTEPVFPTLAGATVTDGTAVWTCRGAGRTRRRVWLQRLGVDATPVNVVTDLQDADGLYDEAPAAAAIAGTIWLAWASNRGGHAQIWIRSWPGSATAAGPARPLTEQKADNRNPTLATPGTAGAPLRAAWQSAQSGQTQIWTSLSTDAGVTWSDPAVASAGPLDRMPASVFDAAGQYHLFWSTDAGQASWIRHAVLSGSAWTVSNVTAATPFLHDDAPAAVLWSGAIWLFWHANRFAPAWRSATTYLAGAFVVPPSDNGLWYECTTAGTSGATVPAFPIRTGLRITDGTAAWTCRGTIANAPLARRTRIWSATGPAFATLAKPFELASNSRQPAAVVEAAGDLRLFLTSQKTGDRFRSRTVDTEFTPATGREAVANQLAKTTIGGFADRLHYTSDTRRIPQAMVARDTVVLYLTPNDGQTDAQHAQTVAALRAFVTPFQPVTTRIVYNVKQSGAAGFTAMAADP
jgi:hypothetical protein